MKKFKVSSLRKNYTKNEIVCLIVILVVLTIVIFSLMENNLIKKIDQQNFISNFFYISTLQNIVFVISVILISSIILFYEKQKKYCDYLTKLFLIEKMYIDINKCVLKLDTFSIAYFDLDNFSKINSQYGHLAANEILVNFANNAIDISPDISWYRVGGDEFLAIIGEGKYDLETNTQKIYSLSHQKILIDSCVNQEIELFVSIGTANYPTDEVDVNNLISKADKKMYKNKDEKKAYK
ncbi:MAG: GGDEF domain-containing protein [Clostridia bacterium]